MSETTNTAIQTKAAVWSYDSISHLCSDANTLVMLRLYNGIESFKKYFGQDSEKLFSVFRLASESVCQSPSNSWSVGTLPAEYVQVTCLDTLRARLLKGISHALYRIAFFSKRATGEISPLGSVVVGTDEGGTKINQVLRNFDAKTAAFIPSPTPRSIALCNMVEAMVSEEPGYPELMVLGSTGNDANSMVTEFFLTSCKKPLDKPGTYRNRRVHVLEDGPQALWLQAAILADASEETVESLHETEYDLVDLMAAARYIYGFLSQDGELIASKEELQRGCAPSSDVGGRKRMSAPPAAGEQNATQSLPTLDAKAMDKMRGLADLGEQLLKHAQNFYGSTSLPPERWTDAMLLVSDLFLAAESDGQQSIIMKLPYVSLEYKASGDDVTPPWFIVRDSIHVDTEKEGEVLHTQVFASAIDTILKRWW